MLLERRKDSGDGTDTDSGNGFDLSLPCFRVSFDDIVDRSFYANYCAKVGGPTGVPSSAVPTFKMPPCALAKPQIHSNHSSFQMVLFSTICVSCIITVVVRLHKCKALRQE